MNERIEFDELFKLLSWLREHKDHQTQEWTLRGSMWIVTCDCCSDPDRWYKMFIENHYVEAVRRHLPDRL